jgi:isoleucyl-tRNA synthetase
MAYPKSAASGAGVPASPNLPEVERGVLAYWAQDATFEASIEAREAGVAGDNEYVFYDGPPFANGLPHYGHLLTGYAKDVVPRYQTMRGRRVERRFGWDCHGLPAEVEAEKQLGLTTKAEILDLGVDTFNEACKTSVLRYTKDWERYVTRQARWVDFANDYKTLDLSYMESVMWAFKTLYDKGLIYEGFRVLAYCWRCETPLSNTETRMDDVYRDRQDPALTVWFTLETEPGAPTEKIAVWTTTPWTLPSNLALAVGPQIEYAVLERDGEKAYVGAARLGTTRRSSTAGSRPGRSPGRTWPGGATRRCSTSWLSRPDRTPSRSSPPTSSRPRTVRASCTVPPPSARTTRWSATRRASRRWSPSMTTPSSPRSYRPLRGCRSSRRTGL